MEIYVKNTNFEIISVIDSFKSFIWTDRYCEYGDFELYTPMNTELIETIKMDYYLSIGESEHTMIVENISIESDAEDGDMLKITGRSLESILDRRIIWGSKILKGELQTVIKEIINESIISPSIPERKIENFKFIETDDAEVAALTVEETEYNGDTIYDVVSSLCSAGGIGFKILLNEEDEFVFFLYSGDDLSYEQTDNPYVTFSPEFDNLINSNYIESKQEYKNVTLVIGERVSDSAPKTAVAGEASGLDRRELYTEASDISQTQDDDIQLSSSEYEQLLTQRGNEELQNKKISKTFDGEFDTTQLYTYNDDFYMGDIVQLANAYSMTARARIVEFILSQDENGYSMYPTFSILE